MCLRHHPVCSNSLSQSVSGILHQRFVPTSLTGDQPVSDFNIMETRMIPAIQDQADSLRSHCLNYGVQRLEVFGSAATSSKLPEDSDLEFLVEFQPKAYVAYADTYFGLLEDLQHLFGGPVDLVVASAFKNPYFLQSIERTKTLVYEATRADRQPRDFHDQRLPVHNLLPIRPDSHTL